MGSVEVTASAWRLVEVGRVVLFASGPFTGRLATVVEIIDHKRVRLRPENYLEGFWKDIGGMRKEKLKELEVNMNPTGPR
jgi:hypothetical protein